MRLYIKASYICVAHLFNLRDAQADLIVSVETSLLGIKLIREQVHKLSRHVGKIDKELFNYFSLSSGKR